MGDVGERDGEAEVGGEVDTGEAEVDSGEAERGEGRTERGSSGEVSENRKDKETDGEGETVEVGEA